MYQINAYLNESTGEKQTELVKLEQKQKGKVIGYPESEISTGRS